MERGASPLRHSIDILTDLITLMLITIEKPVAMAKIPKHVDLLNSNRFEDKSVKDESGHRVKVVSGVGYVYLVHDEGNAGVEYNPALLLPVRNKRNLVCLVVYWHLLAYVVRLKTQPLQHPMMVCPCSSVGLTPGGFHRVFGVALYLHRDCNIVDFE